MGVTPNNGRERFLAGRGRTSKNIQMDLRRKIGSADGSARIVAAEFNVSRATVYAARAFVRREMAGERYDEDNRVWI